MRKALFIMASALLIAGCGGQKSETPQKKEMSLQLYSIRAEFKKAKEAGEDYSDILKKVAEAGFTSVEAASYNDGKLYGDEPQVYRKKVEDAGLVSLSSHVSCRLSPEELESWFTKKDFEAMFESLGKRYPFAGSYSERIEAFVLDLGIPGSALRKLRDFLLE